MIRRLSCLFACAGVFLIFATANAATPTNTITIADRSGTASHNYPLQFGRPFLEGAITGDPEVMIDGKPVLTQADVKNRYPDGSVEFAVISVMIPNIPANGKLTLSFANQPRGKNIALTAEQMLDPVYNFDAEMKLAFTSGTTAAASARAMLQNGNYKLWTSGPVAQTIELADDTTARKYDLGNGDGYHPFRPRFYATFWPAIHQVSVRYVGENGLTTELEDLTYRLTLTLGKSNPQTVFSFDLSGTQAKEPKKHWALSNWTKVFWLGHAPPEKIDIDNNLPYLEATHFIPNYDPSIAIPEAAIAAESAQWSKRPNELYDGNWNGKGVWQTWMTTVGGRGEIAPYPQWTVMWLYTGDWRLREMALGLADTASGFPANLRESDPTRNLSRADPPGAGTGLGHTVSITDRRSLLTLGNYLWTYERIKPQDRVIKVGAVGDHQQWSYQGGHEPAPFYPQYLLTGDPYYLNEMYMWAGMTAGQTAGDQTNSPFGRGPTGAEGGFKGELRAAGWIIRNRAETAFIAPDTDPEKAYFTYLTNDALARWEAGFGITGTPFSDSYIAKWGAAMGDGYASTGGPDSGKPPPLHNWESNVNPTKLDGEVAAFEKDGTYRPGAVGSYTSPWMQFYDLYGIGRVRELGFAAGPLLDWSGQYLTGMINNSGEPRLVGAYRIPVEPRGGGYFQSWSGVLAAFTPTYLGSTLPIKFSTQLSWADGYPFYALSDTAYLVDNHVAGAVEAWKWLEANVYRKAPDKTAILKWAIVPRTGDYRLPAQPTAIPGPPRS